MMDKCHNTITERIPYVGPQRRNRPGDRSLELAKRPMHVHTKCRIPRNRRRRNLTQSTACTVLFPCFLHGLGKRSIPAAPLRCLVGIGLSLGWDWQITSTSASASAPASVSQRQRQGPSRAAAQARCAAAPAAAGRYSRFRGANKIPRYLTRSADLRHNRARSVQGQGRRVRDLGDFEQPGQGSRERCRDAF